MPPEAEAGVGSPDRDRRAPNGALEQKGDPVLHDEVCRQPDRVLAGHDRFEHDLPAVCRVNVAGRQRRPFEGGAGELAVVRSAFLITTGRAGGRIHVEYD